MSSYNLAIIYEVDFAARYLKISFRILTFLNSCFVLANELRRQVSAIVGKS